jgi:hypothetical protein
VAVNPRYHGNDYQEFRNEAREKSPMAKTRNRYRPLNSKGYVAPDQQVNGIMNQSFENGAQCKFAQRELVK